MTDRKVETLASQGQRWSPIARPRRGQAQQPQSQVGPRPPTPPKPPLGCQQGGPYDGSSPTNKTEAQVEAEWEAAGRPQVQEMPAWLKENIERAKGRG